MSRSVGRSMTPVSYSHHLVGLVARAQAAAARIAGADPDRRSAVAQRSRRRDAVLSCRLDGSPLTDQTAADVDDGSGPQPVGTPAGQAPGDPRDGWARALRLEGMETQEVAAIEYANVLGLTDVEAELAGIALTHPLDTLRRLHGVVAHGLVDGDVIGAPRVTEQAVHDGAQGMVIFNAPDPSVVRERLADLDAWVRRRSLVVPPVIVAGVVHQRLLELQPFEAANGRVARAYARLVLLAHGLDPHGAAVLWEPTATDPGGYFAEVAATIRRRGDLTIWLERHTAGVAMAWEAAADTLDPDPRPAPPDRGVAVVGALPGGGELSVRDYAKEAGVDLRTAMADLRAFVLARELVDVPGGGGLRFRRPPRSTAPDAGQAG